MVNPTQNSTTTTGADAPRPSKKYSSLANGLSNVLGGLPHSTEQIRKTAINLLILLTLTAAIVAIAREVAHEQLVIEPMSVPNSFEEDGISGAVFARWISDEILNVQVTARTTRQRALFVSDEELPNISIGGTGFSMRSIEDAVRLLLRQPANRITGEIVVRHDIHGEPITGINCPYSATEQHDSKFQTRLRTSLENRGYQASCGNEIDKLAEAAAHQIIFWENPYTLASYFYEIGLTDEKSEFTNRAVSIARHIIKERPRAEHPWALSLLGRVRENAGDIPSAIEFYREIDRQEFRFAHAYSNWAYALTQLDPPQFEEAIAKYRIATGIDPNDAIAFSNLGISLAKLQPANIKEAIKNFRIALRINPQNPIFHSNLGRALLLLDQPQFPEAIEHFREATKIDPHNAPAFRNWGYALRNSGFIDQGLEAIGHATCLESRESLLDCPTPSLD